MSYKATLSLSAAALFNAVFMLACATLPSSSRPPDKPATPNRERERPPSSFPHTIVLDYEDFGPQVMAYELIGHDWNQWKSEGHELPDDVEVKVVVYRGVSLEEVRGAYPVVRGRSDYRHVEYDRALRFLDTQIGELEEMKKEESEADLVKMWEDIITTLRSTKATIERGLT